MNKKTTFQRFGELSIQEKNKTIKYWKENSKHYEFMFFEQKEICDGYRKIIEGYERLVRDFRLNK